MSETFVKENWFKISIVLVLLVAAFMYNSRLKEERVLSAQRFQAEEDARKKEYVADRKQDCRVTYESESKKWNNVNSWNYNDTRDVCEITYRSGDPEKSDAECQADFEKMKAINPDNPSFVMDAIIARAHCLDNTFTNEF